MSEIALEVVVIGAGVSGLKAATTLVDLGKLSTSQIMVLEAEDRIGGRLNTDRTSSRLGMHYDLGASWFHDALSNVVLQELEQDGSLDWNNDVYFDDKDSGFYDADGKVDVQNMKVNRVVEEVAKFIELYFYDSIDTTDISLQEITNIYLERYRARLTSDQQKYVVKMIRQLELWYGITWDNISAKYAIMDHQGRNLFNVKGYDFLIQKLAKLVGPSIKTGQKVVSIKRDCNPTELGKILLTTSTGSKIYCNNLIVTVPLSVLQLSPEQGISWTPQLPRNIVDALDTIHFGALGKVIFEFDNVWWDEDQDRFEILDNGEHKNPGTPLTDLPAPFSYPAYIINVASSRRPQRVPALLILTQAPLTNYLEAHPNEAWKYFKPMLAKLKGDDKVLSDPINVITTNWTTNPNFGGSYASLYTNDDPSDLIVQLCGDYPGTGLLNNNIKFAGEHTILDGAGCVHGAYASGKRAANYILENYK